MDMQDKEFDKLFSAKLEGLEIEPSTSVWQGINNDLHGNRRKKLIPYLSIAASIIVLIAAGILFISKKQNDTKSPVKLNVVAVKLSANPLMTAKTQQLPVAKASVVAAVKPVHSSPSNKAMVPVETEKKDMNTESTAAVPINTTQVLASAEPTKIDVKQTTIVDSSKNLAAIKPVVQQPEKSAIVAVVTPPGENSTQVSPVKKHKIRGIGDLLNVAIAAVDKRKDKIIEFGDSDGDGAVVTGVNLGIIKIKKEN